jgi:hypothetical protein
MDAGVRPAAVSQLMVEEIAREAHNDILPNSEGGNSRAFVMQ